MVPLFTNLVACLRRLVVSTSRRIVKHGASRRLTICLMLLSLISIPAQAGDAGGTCTNATLHGTYVYAYTGCRTTGGMLTRFAVAGLAVFNGNGTSHGI